MQFCTTICNLVANLAPCISAIVQGIVIVAALTEAHASIAREVHQLGQIPVLETRDLISVFRPTLNIEA